MRLPTPMITAQPGGLSQELLSLLGTQPDAAPMGLPTAPLDLMSLGPAEDEQRQADLQRQLFDLAKKMKLMPDQTEAMKLIAAAFERFGRA